MILNIKLFVIRIVCHHCLPFPRGFGIKPSPEILVPPIIIMKSLGNLSSNSIINYSVKLLILSIFRFKLIFININFINFQIQIFCLTRRSWIETCKCNSSCHTPPRISAPIPTSYRILFVWFSCCRCRRVYRSMSGVGRALPMYTHIRD